jgi:hypothetical protein
MPWRRLQVAGQSRRPALPFRVGREYRCLEVRRHPMFNIRKLFSAIILPDTSILRFNPLLTTILIQAKAW